MASPGATRAGGGHTATPPGRTVGGETEVGDEGARSKLKTLSLLAAGRGSLKEVSTSHVGLGVDTEFSLPSYSARFFLNFARRACVGWLFRETCIGDSSHRRFDSDPSLSHEDIRTGDMTSCLKRYGVHDTLRPKLGLGAFATLHAGAANSKLASFSSVSYCETLELALPLRMVKFRIFGSMGEGSELSRRDRGSIGDSSFCVKSKASSSRSMDAMVGS